MESTGTIGARCPRSVATAVVVVAATVLLGWWQPAAAQYGGTQGFVIDPPVINTGDSVAFLGTGCEGEATVVFTVEPLGDLELGTTRPTETGDFYLPDVVITLDPGVYPVTATCGATELVAELTVLAEGEGIGVDTDGDGIPDALAFTGSGTLIVKGGLVAGAVGLVFILVSRRRDNEDATAAA